MAKKTANSKPKAKSKPVLNPKVKPKLKQAAKKPPIKKTGAKKTVKPENNKIIGNLSEKTAISKRLPDAVLDFCGVNLTKQRHDFLIYYLTPGSSCFHNALQAALKAGYSKSTASSITYQLFREPNIQKIVEANKKLGYQSIHEAAKMAIEAKKERAFFDVADYYQQKEIEIETKHGTITKKAVEMKPFEELTELQRRYCVSDIDLKGQASIPMYVLPNKEKEQNDIIKLDAELSKTVADTGEEETKEIIIERITVRETKRAQRPLDMAYEIIDEGVASV